MSDIMIEQITAAHTQLISGYLGLIKEVSKKPRWSLMRAIVEDHVSNNMSSLSQHYLHMGMDPANDAPDNQNWFKKTAGECKSYAENLNSLSTYVSLPNKLLKATILIILSLVTISIFGESKNIIEVLTNTELRNTIIRIIHKNSDMFAILGVLINFPVMLTLFWPFRDTIDKTNALIQNYFPPLLAVNEKGNILNVSQEEILLNQIGLIKEIQIPFDVTIAYFVISICSFITLAYIYHVSNEDVGWVFISSIILHFIYFYTRLTPLRISTKALRM